ncbi:DUF4132 domain-containing protein [Neolewinella agarilytica]|uniref:DUF4132 domain-containing protein n=1 Tax=Neolewinella agarilytica TaxID=478744 RepID=A0A1H9F0U6_9BACT|nr:DUF4132 domain-containing protein [Neolewinella agarilytica]SEQ31511.1 protein of unknown function [Neolewinella agarilytica]
MISSEQAQKFLKQHQSPQIEAKHFAHLSASYRQLGNIITLWDRGSQKRSERDVFIEAFGEDPTFNPFTTTDGAKLAVILFGAPKAHLVPAIWELTHRMPYQGGYSRRPFRRKPEANPLERRLERMRQIFQAGKLGFSGLDVFQTAQYAGYYQWQSSQMAPWFAAALNDPATADKFRTLLADIIAGEDEIGIVNRGIINGLLLTDDPQNWAIVEGLLLAAQRQEGLRQTILESLDETSTGALNHFIGIVQEHKLARFSAVVRAVDTWFGFGWEAPKQKTIERTLALAQGYLNDPVSVTDGLADKDSLVSYVALWSVALTNVDEALKLAVKLLFGEDRTKKLLALLFISETGLSNTRIEKYIHDHFGEDLEIDYWLLRNAPSGTEITDSLFDRIIHYGDSLPKEGTKFVGTIFSWRTTEATQTYFYSWLVRRGGKEQLRRLCEDVSKIPSTTREQLLRRVFPNAYSYSLNYSNPLDKETAKKAAGEDWKRELIRQSATDRNSAVMATGVRFLGALELEEADRTLIMDLLRRKGKDLRAELIKVILGQDEQTLKAMVSELIAARSVDQRLAALEIMTVLYEKDQLTTFVLAQHGLYRERGKFNKNEEVLLAKFDAPLEGEISYNNGFGIIDFDNLTPLIEPKIQFTEKNASGLAGRLKSAAANIVNRMTAGGGFLFPELVDKKKMLAALNDLLSLLQKHGKHEYECWSSKQYSNLTLLENDFGLTEAKAHDLPPRERLNYLPLPEVWQGWHERWQLTDFELIFSIRTLNQHNASSWYNDSPLAPFLQQYAPGMAPPDLPGTPAEKRAMQYGMSQLLRMFLAAYGDDDVIFQFQVDVLEDMIARLPEKLKGWIHYKNQYGYDNKIFWADQLANAVPGGLQRMANRDVEKRDPKVLKRLWDLQLYLMAQSILSKEEGDGPSRSTAGPGTVKSSVLDIARFRPKRHNGRHPFPTVWTSLHLHEKGLINDDDLLVQSLQLPGIFQLMNGNRMLLHRQNKEEMVIPTRLMDPLRKNLLDLELQRGDLETDATPYVKQLPVVEGMDYVFRTLERLGKETLQRGYSYSSGTSKKESFSAVLKKSIASSTDTAPAFSARAKTSPILPQRWLEVAMYAPQWAPWIAEHLKMKDLEIAVWWFHAHASDYMSGQKEKTIAQLSPIPKEDFAQGAIDIDWFYVAYAGVGKRNWKLLHDAAKYISDGNGHRQVKTYSSVMLGEVKITETLKRIKEKRDKVYVKALGLIPFSRTRPEKDILNRYKVLQEFVRESKQFGAQRQESERTAARIGLDNLARNAGYDDVTRFTWIMEAEATRTIMDRSLVSIDNVAIQLLIDEDGKADIRVTKDNKPQKSIPAKLRKNKAILTLKEHKTDLRRQFSRTRQSLENAMLAGITFSPEDLVKINQHPVVKPMLAKLVLFAPERGLTGFWRHNQLLDATGKAHDLSEEDRIVIAHPAHLYRAIEWDRYQRYAFDEKLVQPFKQIFRELYLITDDEREQKIQSLRYQGHQIQPKKAAALLRTRGWTVSDTEGLQKVYHKQNVVATMYALADWYSPSDVEAPVIEGVTFHNRRREILPLEELDPVLFSEVMRDIDLVVSVAHVGGVDPEASHSTLQMRAALARESARLFKADNVEVKQRHIVIEGKMGSYNIHLGSGMVSKGGLQLNIIAVQSQHRGRLFLPFLDDDPKSAEIISKMKLLAEDDRIKDPTVLGQILG